LSRHYRKPIVFSRDKLGAVKNTIDNLDNFVQKVNYCHSGIDDPSLDQSIYDLKNKFTESMDDDFNTAAALAALFQFTRRLNTIMDNKGLSTSGKNKVLKALDGINQVMGVMDLEPAEVDEAVETLIRQREEARQHKDWGSADMLRKKLKQKGVEVIDTKEGPVWKKVKG